MDSGSLAWVLTAAALVLFMTPGLAFFYGGMDRRRNVLNMLMMNFYCLLIIPILWMVLAYSLAQVPLTKTSSISNGEPAAVRAAVTSASVGRSSALTHPSVPRERT